MLRSMFAPPLFALALCAAPLAGQVDPGSIAVMPFGSGFRGQCALDCAQAMSNVVQEELDQSGRFLAVLPRNPQVEAAISSILTDAEGPGNFDSYIQISTEAGLNANYLLDGYVENMAVQPERRGDAVVYDARMTVRIRIVDVETGGLVLSKGLVVTNGLLEGVVGSQEECGRFDVACKARQAAADVAESVVENSAGGLGADATPQEAVQSAVENAGDAIREFIQAEMSLRLVDYDVDDNDVVSELVIASAPDVQEGMTLDIGTRTKSRMSDDTRDRSVGSAEVTQVDGDYTYARVTDGADRIDAALRDGDLVVVRPARGGE